MPRSSLPLGMFVLCLVVSSAGTAPADEKKDAVLPAAIRKAVETLKATDKALVMQQEFLIAANDAALAKTKEEIEKTQKAKVADVFFDMSQAVEALSELKAERDKEKDPYWKANYDYTLARLYVRMTQVLEYNAMLGKIRRDDMPELDKQIHKGWRLVPQDKFSDRDSRELSMKALELFKQLGEEHKGTAWELIAQKEGGAPMGFTWVPLDK